MKNELHASAGTLGLVVAAGGLGAVGAAVFMGHRGHPRRDVTVMYVTWTLATLAIAGYGIANAAWQLMIACLLFNALEAAGTIVWATIKQRHVPGSMLGRVSSLDWLVSIALMPLSFALTAPVAAVVGVRATLVGCRGARCGRHLRCVLPAGHDGDRADERPRSRRLAGTGRCDGLDRAKTPGYKRHLLMNSGFARLGDTRRLSLHTIAGTRKPSSKVGFLQLSAAFPKRSEHVFGNVRHPSVSFVVIAPRTLLNVPWSRSTIVQRDQHSPSRGREANGELLRPLLRFV